MPKSRLVISHLVTALLIPCLVIAAYNIDPITIRMYQRYEIQPVELFWVWRGIVVLVVAIATIWIASRAINPQPGNTVSIAVGLVICTVFLFTLPHYFGLDDTFGTLIWLLTCVYLCSLVVTLAGRLIA